MGDRDLKMLFRGHSASPYFMAGQQVLMAAWRKAKRSKALPGTWREVGWVLTLRTFLQKIGCLEVAAWRWTTRLGGIIDLDPSSGDFDQTSGAVGHNTREAWRLTHFERWLARSDARIDSRQCQAIIYNEQRCTLTRKLVANDSHRFAVVTGASVSPQKFEVMLSHKDRRNGREPNTILCPWCKEARGADWEHMVSKCNASGKPPELAPPTDLLQRRLGWASIARAHSYNFAVLDWMAEVRQRILEERYEHMSSAPKVQGTGRIAAAATAASYSSSNDHSNRQTAKGAAAATSAATATATAAATRQPQKRKAASQSSGRSASAGGDQKAVTSSSTKSKLSTPAKKRKCSEVLNGCPPLKKCRRSTTAAVPGGVVS
ncbi:unnamed protein product [Polarella glacialis]|uniref:Uncharacterized protein n=1 Tax=Polarella glacialis TaxID=89957 RepID=A0A813H5C0_POLGL|nr:unnamed protein product [Polarella glacialis]